MDADLMGFKLLSIGFNIDLKSFCLKFGPLKKVRGSGFRFKMMQDVYPIRVGFVICVHPP
jgi:hypothetical protein